MKKIRFIILFTAIITCFWVRNAAGNESIGGILSPEIQFFSNAVYLNTLHETYRNLWQSSFDLDHNISAWYLTRPFSLKNYGNAEKDSSFLLNLINNQQGGINIMPNVKGGLHISYKLYF